MGQHKMQGTYSNPSTTKDFIASGVKAIAAGNTLGASILWKMYSYCVCHDEQVKHGKNEELSYNKNDKNIIKNNSCENITKKSYR